MWIVVINRYVRRNQVAVLMLPCRHCGGDFAHVLIRERRILALFWLLPIFVRRTHWLQCSSCVAQVGASPRPITNAEASRLTAAAMATTS